MPNVFFCFIHKLSSATPELRVLACAPDQKLADVIVAELPKWDRFERVDVYDDRDHRLFSFAEPPRSRAHLSAQALTASSEDVIEFARSTPHRPHASDGPESALTR
jgi:hypothetical protein